MPRKQQPRRNGEKMLRPLRPNIGLAAEYRRRLYALIDEMATSVEHWVGAAYRRNEPLIARDAEPPQIAATWMGGKRPWVSTIDGEPVRTSKGQMIRFATSERAVWAARRFAGEMLPAAELQAAMQDLSDYWLARFDIASQQLAGYFGKSVARRTDAQLKSILSDAGMSVRFEMTPGMRDVLQATISDNVGLIRSIPQQYLKNVEGMVMRSIAAGRDLATLSKQIEHQYGVTKRRAALIARDQNNKATAYMHDARRKELGIQEAVWIHSGGGKKPRPKHVKADGQRFNVGIGLPIGDKGEYVLPGESINCRCVSRSIIPGP